MNMNLVKPLAIGVVLRGALFMFPEIVETLGSRLEFSTALTRYSEVRQEIQWPSVEGAHRPPLVTQLVKQGISSSLFFIALDCLIAFVLYLSAKLHVGHEEARREKEIMLLTRWNESGRPRLTSNGDAQVTVLERDDDESWPATWTKRETGDLSKETLPQTIASLYLLSPFTILTCAARSFAPLTFLCAISAVTLAQNENPLLAGFALALTCYLDGPSFFAIIGLPVLFKCYSRPSQRISAVLSFGISACGLLLMSYKLEGNSWNFIIPSYVWVFSVPDSRPNVGMWWYLMAEVFERYRTYFLFLLHSFIYLCATPLAVHLGDRPVLHAHFGMAVLQAFQPYPEVFHIFTTLLLLFMHPQFALVIPGLAPILLVACFSMALQPVMLFTWLGLGSGNANYYYFQCLIVNGMLCAILLQFHLAVVTRDAVIRRIGTYLTMDKEVIGPKDVVNAQ